jgi:hypothetical protein
VTVETIEVLAKKADASAAEAIVELLAGHVANIGTDTLCRILTELGGDFARIAVHGKDRPKVPVVPGMEAILKRLRADGIVSKFPEDTKHGTFRVSKHHG